LTQALYGVPGVPATCFLDSVEHALTGFVAGAAAVSAAATTHALNGVPGVPATCFLLSVEQALIAARLASAEDVELDELSEPTVLAAATTHALNGVPGVPATCFLLSVEHACFAALSVAEVAFAAAVTHALNGVPGVPATCFLLSLWQLTPYALACAGRLACGPTTCDGRWDVPRLLGGFVAGGPVVTPGGGPPGWLELAAIATAGTAPAASATTVTTTLCLSFMLPAATSSAENGGLVFVQR
jgi:hypothetical protein